MIFVTVGTHEQQFNRLLIEIDRLKGTNVISENVFMQIGHSDYVPKHCDFDTILPYQEMEKKAEQARIIITHGGPSTIFLALKFGKCPLVVPRRKEFGEHVDDHQVFFVRKMAELQKVYHVTNISELAHAIPFFSECTKNFYFTNFPDGHTPADQLAVKIHEYVQSL